MIISDLDCFEDASEASAVAGGGGNTIIVIQQRNINNTRQKIDNKGINRGRNALVGNANGTSQQNIVVLGIDFLEESR